MRKFALLLGVCLMLGGLKIWDSGFSAVGRAYPGATVTFYVSSSERIPAADLAGATVINNGINIMIACPAERAGRLRRSLQPLGESVCLPGSETEAEEILALYRAEPFARETLGEDILIYYASSSYLGNGKPVNGGICNLQIAVNRFTGLVTAGTPLILGSY